MKSQRGSISLFMLVALLFYTGFLILLYASNVNKVQTVTEKLNSIKSIYSRNVNNMDEVYNREKEVQIGDYVNYNELSNGKKTYSVDYTQNGGTSSDNNQTFETEDLGWRVLDIADNGQITLISDNPTTATIYLRGENGYLNGEDILNNTCNELYGKGTYAESARSLNVEDIDTLAGITTEEQKKSLNSWYGTVHQYRYPTQEEMDEYTGTENSTRYIQYRKSRDGGKTWSEWEQSKSQTFRMPGSDNTLSEEIPGVSEELTYTYYNYTVANLVKQTTSDGKNMADIITKGTKTSYVSQWLASRSLAFDANAGYCRFQIIRDGEVVGRWVFYSSNKSNTDVIQFRPVVILNSNVKLVKDTATDTWNIQ